MFIKVQLESQNIFYKIINIRLISVIASSNEHRYSGNLISIANGILYLDSVTFNQNYDFDNIVYLHSSMLYMRNHNDIRSNHARHIIKAQSNSFLYIDYMATADVSYNAVYKIIKQVRAVEKHAIPLCPLQVYGNYFHLEHVECTLVLSNNIEMISKALPTELYSYDIINVNVLKVLLFKSTM